MEYMNKEQRTRVCDCTLFYLTICNHACQLTIILDLANRLNVRLVHSSFL